MPRPSEIEEEVARTLAEWWQGPSEDEPELWLLDMYTDAAKSLSPLLNRVRAEALREAADKIDQWRTGSGDLWEPVGEFRVVSHGLPHEWLLKEADRIEQNSEGNET